MTYIPRELRDIIVHRAQYRCEYCLIHEELVFHPHEIDHIYAEKHGGQTEEVNLCYSCYSCNRYKGSDLASLHPNSKKITRLFHPRTDRWKEHFRLEGVTIVGITDVAIVTIQLLRLNKLERLAERHLAIQYGLYP